MRCALVLLLTLAASSCAVLRQRLAVTCYSGGKVIYRGNLVRHPQIYEAWYDEEGNVVVLTGDCVGFAKSDYQVVIEAVPPPPRERCLDRCAGVPAYRRDRCIENCPPETQTSTATR